MYLPMSAAKLLIPAFGAQVGYADAGALGCYARKLTAEGIEALKEVSGSTDDVLANLVGGLQSGMGYLGAKDLPTLREKACYIRVSPAGQKEAAPHDVIEIKAGAKG